MAIISNFPSGGTAVATQSKKGLMSASDKTKLDGIETGAQVNSITGIKGNAESSYRTGNVNLTPANIGAYSKTEVDARLNTNVVDHTVYMSTLFSVADHTVTFNSNS